MTTRRRRRAAAELSARKIASLLAAAAALGAACNAPERLFDGASSSTTSGSSSDAASSVSASSSGGASSATGAGGSGSEASSSSGSSLPCVGDGGPCDCDGDGDESWECDGGDCADYDSRAHTMADFVLSAEPMQGPRKPGTQDFDFNCDGIVEGQIPPVPNCNLLGKGGCQGSGFLGSPPACGGLASLAHCNANLLVCETINDSIAKTQGCR